MGETNIWVTYITRHCWSTLYHICFPTLRAIYSVNEFSKSLGSREEFSKSLGSSQNGKKGWRIWLWERTVTQEDWAARLEPRVLQGGHCCWHCGPSWTPNSSTDLGGRDHPDTCLCVVATVSNFPHHPGVLGVTLLVAETWPGASCWPGGGYMPTQQQSGWHPQSGCPPRVTQLGDFPFRRVVSESW